jgi:hypothetical protein
MNILGFNSGRFMRYVKELNGRNLNLPLQNWCFELNPTELPPVRRRRQLSSPPTSPPQSLSPSPPLVIPLVGWLLSLPSYTLSVIVNDIVH